LVEVLNVEFIELDEPVAVYDVEIPIDESFQCGGVVLHNSPICRSLDHRIFKVGEGRRPPFHINCRSTFILVLDPKYRGKGNTDKRASYEGVTDNKSYYEWLKTQPKTFQDDALGKTRAALFRDGGLSADDFAKLNLNKNFEPLTLDEMRAKNPTAFEKAGL